MSERLLGVVFLVSLVMAHACADAMDPDPIERRLIVCEYGYRWGHYEGDRLVLDSARLDNCTDPTLDGLVIRLPLGDGSLTEGTG